MNKNTNINLQLISTIIFIIATFISLSITYDEKLRQENKKNIYSEQEALDLSFYNRIIFLIAVLISFYVAIDNYLKQETDREKYKSGLLLLTSIITIISSLIIIYISYLNKNESTLSASDTQNTLI